MKYIGYNNVKILLLERAMGFEPTTFCLGSKHSTTELRPLALQIIALFSFREVYNHILTATFLDWVGEFYLVIIIFVLKQVIVK